jgi:peptide deformylase
MAVLPILKAEHPVLRGKAKRVGRIDGSLQKLIDDMAETMRAVGGVGLAAPQVGVPLRLAVIEVPADYEDPYAGELIVLVNPEIVKSADEYSTEEGCLSLPGYAGDVQRAKKVTFKAKDRNGKEYRLKTEGLLAQAVQHEIDHLDGVLFYDHLPSMEALRRLSDREPSGSGAQAGESD